MSRFLDRVYPNDLFERLKYLNGEGSEESIPKYGLLVEVDATGQVLQSWHGKSIGFVSEGLKYTDGYIYLASAVNKFVARIPDK